MRMWIFLLHKRIRLKFPVYMYVYCIYYSVCSIETLEPSQCNDFRSGFEQTAAVSPPPPPPLSSPIPISPYARVVRFKCPVSQAMQRSVFLVILRGLEWRRYSFIM